MSAARNGGGGGCGVRWVGFVQMGHSSFPLAVVFLRYLLEHCDCGTRKKGPLSDDIYLLVFSRRGGGGSFLGDEAEQRERVRYHIFRDTLSVLFMRYQPPSLSPFSVDL